jgi:GntR family transcriptional regulator
VRPPSSRAERSRLLGRDVEQLAVEASRLGLTLDDLQAAVANHWRRLHGKDGQ